MSLTFLPLLQSSVSKDVGIVVTDVGLQGSAKVTVYTSNNVSMFDSLKKSVSYEVIFGSQLYILYIVFLNTPERTARPEDDELLVNIALCFDRLHN